MTGALLLLTALGCIRPSDDYPVQIYGAGTALDEVLPDPEPMGGTIEYTRMRLWGSNLGHGLSGLYGDSPRADGTSFTVGYAYFGYPADPGFDRNSSFLSPGPPVDGSEDLCMTRLVTSGYLGITEYVDVGDHIALSRDGGSVVLERDPSVHHRPAGESWFAGYGGRLGAVVTGHDYLPDTWRGDATWDIRFPGTVSPPDSTMGSVPYPLTEGSIRFPADVSGVSLDGVEVRAPHHEYDDEGVWDPEVEDDVRYPGPWTGPVTVSWEPSDDGQPVTIVVRYLGVGEEEACDCNWDCSAGFTCDEQLGACLPDEGSGWVPEGELVCTVADDGEFVLEPSRLDILDTWVDPTAVHGRVLGVARISEGTVEVADALTFNDKRVVLTPVRTRVSDVLWTRLEAP